MKKLTLISAAITILGLLMPIVANNLLPFDILIDIGNFLIGIGLLMFYIFLIAWQAEISRARLITTLLIFGFFFLTLIIFSFIKANDAEKATQVSYQLMEEAESHVKELKQNLIDKEDFIKSLEKELKQCKENHIP
jgi:hypothetical protein